MVVNEENAANAFELIEAHNRQLIGEIGSPDFDGDTKLDPTLNNGERYIHAADEVVVSYPQGAFPLEIARGAVETTLQLLMICEMRYGKPVVKPMSQKFRHLINLWYYNGDPTHPAEIFTKAIFVAERALFNAMEDANCKMFAADSPRREDWSETVTKAEVSKIVRKATADIKSTVITQTEGKNEGCHHRDKEKDRIVQEVIRYLARPGVAFSVHNACAQVLRGSSAANRWLYLWCHRHERQLHDCVDIIRS